MSEARAVVLGRIRRALAPGMEPDMTVERTYRREETAGMDDVVTAFARRVAEYRATVVRTTAADLPASIGARLAERRIHSLAVPLDLPAEWLPDGPEIHRDDGLTAAQLDAMDGALTGCALGIALTGTIVLDGGPRQGRRALTLVPDYHLCVIDARQIVDLVPEAIERLHAAAREGRPITFISGPSATSDIELNRVEGVHGPRTLDVVIVS